MLPQAAQPAFLFLARNFFRTVTHLPDRWVALAFSRARADWTRLILAGVFLVAAVPLSTSCGVLST